MKKLMLTILVFATFFISPIAVFASENENTLTENDSVMIMDEEHTMDCSNYKSDIKMLKDHRIDIINKLKNGEITQEQAVMHIKHINQMITLNK